MSPTIRTRRSRRGAAILVGSLLALASACASDERIADDWMARTNRTEASAPLGGESLAQRKLELDRSYRDLSHFYATVNGLARRNDRSANLVFAQFCDSYIDQHVLPLLEGEWQSRHPEVAVLDANARIAVSAVWARMGAVQSSARMLDEVERRYKGRGEMLVAFPFGSQSTLKQSVARLRKR